MKIIILGAGEVGGSLARILAAEDNDITLVDEQAEKLDEYVRSVDLRTVVGRASHPEVLAMADAANADMIIALTREDETNMVACQIAHSMFNVPTKIARIRSSAYRKYPELFNEKDIPVDVVIRPEQQLTDTITNLIKYPKSLRVVEFANGNLLAVALRAEASGALTEKRLSDIPALLGKIDARIVAIYRGEEQIIGPRGKEKILPGDLIFLVATEYSLRSLMGALSGMDKPYQRIFIAGGGNVGLLLAQHLEEDYSVKIIDHNAATTKSLIEALDNTVVLQGDATNSEILLEENIDTTDVFCAVTNSDESNIVAGMFAKHLGARKAMVLVRHTDYHELVQQTKIDIVISPQQDSVSAVLQYIRKGDVVKAYSLHRGKAEAIEAVAHGDASVSRVVGRSIAALQLPQNVVIAAVVRGGKPIVVLDESFKIEMDDHVILFVNGKQHLRTIEKLFQVKVSFF